ncbi:hypothetical protein PVL29_011976 [Vitis rotundifolia]|uniref:Uncharacterized protein n=1 Tax=Vitis rotundifolia TaxID=103349 RepID=A0AA38ZQE1_VITRO|nr:hypothetical protein PVL29_011976 [Vitis rotundifolia]
MAFISFFNEFGVDGGPTAESLAPKLDVFSKHVSANVGVQMPEIIVIPILYDFSNYDTCFPSGVTLRVFLSYLFFLFKNKTKISGDSKSFPKKNQIFTK